MCILLTAGDYLAALAIRGTVNNSLEYIPVFELLCDIAGLGVILGNPTGFTDVYRTFERTVGKIHDFDQCQTSNYIWLEDVLWQLSEFWPAQLRALLMSLVLTSNTLQRTF